MMTLERVKTGKYKCGVGSVPLENVAIAEKLLPPEFMNARGNYVTDAFIDYCLPIIGGPIRAFPALAGHKLVATQGKDLKAAKSVV